MNRSLHRIWGACDFRIFLLSVFLLIGTINSASAQSIYLLTYNDAPTGNLQQALLVQYENGTGFIRLRSTNKEGDATIIHATSSEMIVKKNKVIDTATTAYRFNDPYWVTGSGKVPALPNIIFQNRDEQLAPAGYTFSENTDSLSPFASAELLPAGEIEKQLLQGFFREDDDFYAQFFGNKSRGGTLNAEEKKTRIFLLLVASTADTSLGNAPRGDVDKMRQLFTDVAGFMGIPQNLIVDSVFGDRYNKANVEAMLNKLRPGPNDVVVFYYSGHGFMQPPLPKKVYPFLDLRDPLKRPRPKPEAQCMNIEDIYNIITKKGARVNLVISDCCNNEVLAKKIEAPPPPKPKGSGVKWNFDNVKSLFFTKRSMLLAAASRGEKALFTSRIGSFYTNYLVASLTTFMAPGRSNPTWEKVIEETSIQTVNKAKSYDRDQHPKTNVARGF